MGAAIHPPKRIRARKVPRRQHGRRWRGLAFLATAVLAAGLLTGPVTPAQAVKLSVTPRTPVAAMSNALDEHGNTVVTVLVQASYSGALSPRFADVFVMIEGGGVIYHSFPEWPGRSLVYRATFTCSSDEPVSVKASWYGNNGTTDGIANAISSETLVSCRAPVSMLWGAPWKSRLGQGAGVFGVAAIAVPYALANVATAGTLGLIAGGLGLVSVALGFSAADPPDPAYDHMVSVVPYDLKPKAPWTDVPAAARPLLANLMDAHAGVIEQSIALGKTINKWQGALAAQDQRWQAEQATAALGFSHRLATKLRALADIQDSLKAELTAAGMTDSVISQQDLQASRDRWIISGPTPQEQAVLTEAGWDEPVIPGWDPVLTQVQMHWAGANLSDFPTSVFDALAFGASDARQAANELDAWAKKPVIDEVRSEGTPLGSEISIWGKDLAPATAVTVGGSPATAFSCTATECTVTVPPGSGAVPVQVTTPGGTSDVGDASTFTYPTMISGRVTFKGRGVPNLEIGGIFAVTDADGYYRAAVAPGDYEVTFPGNIDQDVAAAECMATEYYPNRRTWQQPGVVSVAVGQHVTGIDADLEACASMSGSAIAPRVRTQEPIQVQVFDRSGTLMDDFSTDGRSWTAGDPKRGFPAKTEHWASTQLEPGTYYLWFFDEDTQTAEYWNNRPAKLPIFSELNPPKEGADPIVLGPGEQRTGMNVVLGGASVKAPKKLREGKRVALPRKTDTGRALTWRSATTKVCKVVRGGSKKKPVWSVKGVKRGTCKLKASTHTNPQSWSFRIPVK